MDEYVKIATTLKKQKIAANQYRFRGSIYVDIFIEDPDLSLSLEEAKEKAKNQIEEAKNSLENNFDIGYAYVGGIAYNPPGQLINKDLENLVED